MRRTTPRALALRHILDSCGAVSGYTACNAQADLQLLPVRTPNLSQAWQRFWFRSASPLGPIVVRTLLAVNALWIIMSRPNLPALSGWPRVFWASAIPYRAARFLIVPGMPQLEMGLYMLLHIALIACIIGILPRLACFASGLLLYHFAPFEEVMWHSQGPALRGLTFPVLGLLVLSFAPGPGVGHRSSWSPEFRWPVALVQALFCFQYLGPGITKLKAAGLAWAMPDTIRRAIIWTTTAFAEQPPWAHRIANDAFWCGVIAVVTLVTELLFPLVLVSRTAALILPAIALIGHFGIAQTLGVAYLNALLLLIFLPFDTLASKIPRFSL
jgi:hypothetical protein